MRKKLMTLCFALAAFWANATNYYQGYPLTVTQTTNGIEFRLECSVYDSSLATVQTYNTDYFEFMNSFSNSNGKMAFSAGNIGFWAWDTVGAVGCITYDFEVHQWKTYTKYSTVDGAGTADLTSDDFVKLKCFQPSNPNNDVYFAALYYDIVNHNWIKSEYITTDQNQYNFSINQNTIVFSDGQPAEEGITFSGFNPKNHDWSSLVYSPANTISEFTDDGLAGGYSLDPFGVDDPILRIATLDAQTGATTQDFTSDNVTQYTINSGIYCQRNTLNSEVRFGKYDAQQHLWKIKTFPSSNIANWKSNGGVISFVNNTSSMVISAVYNFNLHQWVYDSVPTPSVSTHAIANGTVTWNNGSGTVTRGYSAVSGWSNSPTALQAVFYLSDLSSPTTGNLINVRNYSIGATGWSYNFGDGTISTEKNLYHLYKINGSYLYSGVSIAANICLNVTNSSGSNSSCQAIGCSAPIATVTAAGATTFCTGGNVTLNAATAAGYTYQWQLNNSNISGETNPSYVATAAGNFTCVVTNACGTATSNVISVTVNAGPSASITAGGPTTFCAGGSVTLNANAGTGLSYQWQLNSSDISGETNSSYAATAAGSYTCVVTNTCGTNTSNAVSVTITSSPSASITAAGPTTFCAGGSVTLNANTGAGLSYQWQLNSSDISGQTSDSYVATAAGSYTCKVSNTCGTITSNAIVTVINNVTVAPINNLTGPTYMCPGSTYNFSVSNIPGATFNWSVPANVIVSAGQGTNAVTLSISPGFASGSVCVNATNGCATSLSKCRGVATANPGRPASIAGELNGLCGAVESYTAASVSGATGYTWSVIGGNILSGQSTQTVSVQWNNSGTTGTLNVAAVNGCGTGLVRSVGTVFKPAVAGALTGPSTLCAGSTNNIFSIPTTAGASSYVWQLIGSGTVITSGQSTNSINATWGAVSGSVLCTPANACGTSQTKKLTVTVNCRMGNDETADNETRLEELIAYPNPFSDQLNVKLNSSDNSEVTIKVTDVAGRIITEAFIPANSVYTLKNNMPNGIYFIQAKQNDSLKTIRVIKSK